VSLVSVSFPLVPFDEEDGDDAPASRVPLPPEDRLWRHPSELGGSTAPVPIAIAGPGSGTKLWGVAVVAGLIGAALSLGVVALAGGLPGTVVEKSVTERVPVQPIAELSNSSGGRGVVSIAKSVAPAVGRVEVTNAKGSATGSAVAFRDDGYYITSARLVAGETALHLVLDDGATVPAQVVGQDASADVAVLKIDHGQVPVATFGSAIDVEVGQTAIAIGAPLAQAGGPSVTVGVISALGRRVESTDGTSLRDMIQTDAPMASGSSGGALCDATGVVIGITTAVDDPTGTGLGFAVPVDVVRATAEDILATGNAHHAWLGVEGADLDSTNAKDMGVAGGAKVTKVVDASPAALAGLQSDDVITSVDGHHVSSMSSFVVALRGHHPGDSITIEVIRQAQAQIMTITLGERTT
jgi:S1-C subfamily serine protease